MDKLTMTNDGEGIYYDCRLIDDKSSLPDYWEGWKYWKEKIADGWTDESFAHRHNLITKLRRQRNG